MLALTSLARLASSHGREPGLADFSLIPTYITIQFGWFQRREWWSRIRLQWAILGSIGPAPAATASTQLIYPLCSETLQLIVVKKSQTSVVMMSSMLGQQPLSPGNLKAMCPSSAMSAQHHNLPQPQLPSLSSICANFLQFCPILCWGSCRES